MVATKKPSRWTWTALAATVPVAESSTDTVCAFGSIARTHIPCGSRCMPRKENGSPCSARITASICGSGRLSTLGPFHPCQDTQHTSQRNVDPAGPVCQLVRHFVDSLFEGEEGQHPARLALVRRVGRATAHRLAIGGEESVHRPLPPCVGQLRHSRLRRGSCLGELPHGGETGVVERADH